MNTIETTKMKLKVNRLKDSGDATISTVSVDEDFFAFGLEDEHRDVKVDGETRIPSGIYNLTLRTVGGFHSRYSERFAEIHQGMIEIADVPGFKYVLIHCGNTEEHTAGCLLIGESCDSNRMTVGASSPAYKKLYSAVIESVKAGEATIEFIDSDRRAA